MDHCYTRSTGRLVYYQNTHYIKDKMLLKSSDDLIVSIKVGMLSARTDS